MKNFMQRSSTRTLSAFERKETEKLGTIYKAKASKWNKKL